MGRRLFDTGSFFGVGVPEAVVVGLLGWFLLGPEELYRLAKAAGNYLGELRVFVGQAAKQYETALDDESTRKAIEGIRETSRTVSEISSSWRSVADSLRDPLALGSTLENTYAKYAQAPKAEEAAKEAEKVETSGAKAEENPTLKAMQSKILNAPVKPADTIPDLEAEDEATPVQVTSGDESEAELEKMRAASQQAAKDLWYKEGDGDGPAAPATSNGLPREAERFLARLDDRLDELETMSLRLDELREGIMDDRTAIRNVLLAQAGPEEPAVAPAPTATLEERPSEGVAVGAAHEGSTAT